VPVEIHVWQWLVHLQGVIREGGGKMYLSLQLRTLPGLRVSC